MTYIVVVVVAMVL